MMGDNSRRMFSRFGIWKGYNEERIEMLNLIIKDESVWFSSLQLSEISGRAHRNVTRDIIRTLITLIEEYEMQGKLDIKCSNKIKEKLSLLKTMHLSKISLMKLLCDVKNKKFPDYFNLKEKIKMKGDPMFDLFGDDVKNVLDEYNRK